MNQACVLGQTLLFPVADIGSSGERGSVDTPWANSFPETTEIALQPSQVSVPVCARMRRLQIDGAG